MKNLFVRFYPILSFCFMALIGWFATGAREVKHEPLVSTKSTSARTSAATKNNREPGVYRVPPYATKHVNAIRAAGDAAAQMRATLALVNSLPLAELHHWMEGRWFDDREGFNLSLFNLVAKERWMREDPSGYYAWAIKNTASDPHSAARLWVQKDPSGALEYLKKNPKPGVLASVLYELAKTNPEIVLAEMNEIITNGSPEEFGNYYSFSNILSRIASLDDPSFLEMIQKWPIKYQNEVEAQVIQREFSKDMTNAIAKISAKPALMSLVDWSETGASDYLITNFATLPDNVRGYLVANAFSVIDRSNVEKWLAMDLSSMGINERQRRNIVNNSFYYLRPEKSLLALNHFEPGSEDYKEVRNNIFSRLGNDLDVLRQFDQALTDPEDRQELAARIAAVENEKAAMELAKEASQQLSPAQQTSLLQKMLDLKEGNSSAFALSISKMKEQELADFSRQFTALSNEQQTQIAGQFMNGSGEMQFLPESMATQLIKTALNSGQKQFETRAIVAASTMTHRKLMTSPTEATVWIDELPEGKGKECSQINLAYNWALYDFNAAQQWVQTLPEASRKKLEAQLKLNGIDIFSK